MNPLNIIRSKDGSLSLTKLAAATFHLMIATTVAYITWKSGEFKLEMWSLYAAVAVGHAAYDKTMAQVKDSRDKAMEAITR